MTWKDSLSSIFGKRNLPSLPEPFLFGVATADHQCEAYDPRFVDIRDVWERVHNSEAARKRATDFWNRYEEDIDLAQNLGCTAFRFSVAWSRIEPEPGKFNQEAIDHYRELIHEVLSCRMKPVLTLHHFTWPVHVERRGGMIADEFPSFFADYVTEVVEHFGKDVPYWLTFNEPNLLFGGYIKPWWDKCYAAPPGLPPGTTPSQQVKAVGKLIRNLFQAHRRAYDIIKAKNPQAQVGANQYFYGLPWWLQQLVNRNISGIRSNDDLLRQISRLAERRSLIRGDAIGKLRSNLLEKEKADVVMALLTQTPEREQQVMFSAPYFVAGLQLLVSSSSSVTDAKDLYGKAIAVVSSSTSEKRLFELVPNARALVVSDYETALQALDQGQAEALLADNTILYELMDRNPGRCRIIGERLTDDELYAAAVSKGDCSLLDALDTAVWKFKKSPQRAEWKASYEKRTGERIEKPPGTIRALTMVPSSIEVITSHRAASGPLPRAPTGTALRRIQDRGYLVAAVRQDLPSFGYRDPRKDEFSGLEIELSREIARQILGDSSKVHFIPVSTQNRISLLLSPLGFLDSILRQYTILSTLIMTNWWYLGMAGKLDEYLCPSECAGKLDFVGLDYYWGIPTLRLERIQRLIDAAYRRFDRAPVCSGALYGLLKDMNKLYPDRPLIIFENGSVERADGIDRATYIRKHVREIQRAVRDGIKVEGYICWAITSNREWDCTFNPGSDFGLYHIDLDTDPQLTRKQTDAASAYKKIIADHAA